MTANPCTTIHCDNCERADPDDTACDCSCHLTVPEIHARFREIAPDPDPCGGEVAAQLARNLVVKALRYEARLDASPEVGLTELDALYSSFAAVMALCGPAAMDTRGPRDTSRIIADAWRDPVSIREWLWERAAALGVDPGEVARLEEALAALRGAQPDAGGRAAAAEGEWPPDAAAGASATDIMAAIRVMAAGEFEDAIREGTDRMLAEKLPEIEAAVRASERARILAAAWELRTTLARPGNGPAHRQEVDVVPFAALRDLTGGGGLTGTDGPGNGERTPETIQAELESLRRKVAEYENAINWNTSCKACATVLDSSARDHERAEQAEAELAKVQRGAETLGKVIIGNANAMEAARIEYAKGDPKAAMEWILQSIPDVWDNEPGTEWDGTETARQWFDRTIAARDLNNDRPVRWLAEVPPGGWVCAVPVDGNNTDGICGIPVESEPCPEHRDSEWRPE